MRAVTSKRAGTGTKRELAVSACAAWLVWLCLSIPLPAMGGGGKILRFGTEADDAPFSSIAANGAPAGFSVDIGNELCRRIGVRCAWVTMPFKNLIPSIDDNRIDAAISQITVTPARSEKVLFTDPVTRTGGLLIVPTLSTMTNKPDSMRGKTLGVQSGTTHEAYADAVLSAFVSIRRYATQAQAFDALAAGKVDATLSDLEIGHEWLEAHSGNFRFADRPIVDPVRYGSTTAIALRRGDDGLRARLDRALSSMVHDKTFARINRQYFTFSVEPGSFGDPL